MMFTHFYLLQGKKQKSGLYLQQAENILTFNRQLFCQQIDKRKLLTSKMNCLIIFFIGLALKIAISVNWCTTRVSLC